MDKKQKILIFAADDYEDLELHYPKIRCEEAGFDVVIAGEKKDYEYKSKHGYPCKTDISFSDVSVKDYIALIIPGGFAPDTLRTIPEVLKITRHFHEEEKLIAFICHGAWIPVSAGILDDIKCTSYFSIRDDVKNAGGIWSDEPVVKDRHFISSRKPEDLARFCSAIIEVIAKNREIIFL